MISLYHKFVRLLELEIESLHDELEIMLRTLDERLANHEITEYVRRENHAVVRNELLGLEDFVRTEFGVTERDGASLEEIEREVKSYLSRRLSERDYVPALYELVCRRIDKIVAYLKTSTPVA